MLVKISENNSERTFNWINTRAKRVTRDRYYLHKNKNRFLLHGIYVKTKRNQNP